MHYCNRMTCYTKIRYMQLNSSRFLFEIRHINKFIIQPRRAWRDTLNGVGASTKAWLIWSKNLGPTFMRQSNG